MCIRASLASLILAWIVRGGGLVKGAGAVVVCASLDTQPRFVERATRLCVRQALRHQVSDRWIGRKPCQHRVPVRMSADKRADTGCYRRCRPADREITRCYRECRPTNARAPGVIEKYSRPIARSPGAFPDVGRQVRAHRVSARIITGGLDQHPVRAWRDSGDPSRHPTLFGYSRWTQPGGASSVHFPGPLRPRPVVR